MQITGKVLEVKVSKKGITIKTQPGKVYDQLDVTIQSSTGEVLTVQKLAVSGNDGQGFVGKTVQCQYKEQGNFLKTNSKGFITLDEPQKQTLQEQVNNQISSAVAEKSVTSQAMTTSIAKSSFQSNSDGMKKGMLFNNAVQVAIQRANNAGNAVLDSEIESALVQLTQIAVNQETGTLKATDISHKEVKSKTAGFVHPTAQEDAINENSPWNE